MQRIFVSRLTAVYTARLLLIVLTAFAGLGVFAVPASAEVERLEIESREPSPGPVKSLAGAYEILRGTAHFALDPEAAVNARVADLDRVPRDADGKVRFTSDFYVFRPAEPERGNGAVVIDIANRGGPLGLLFNFPNYTFQPADPERPMGDSFLERHGFSVAGVGWQTDMPERQAGGMFLRLAEARATESGGTGGLARADFVFPESGAERLELGHWGHRPIPATAPKDPRNVLTVRDAPDAPRQKIARERWRFTDDRVAVALDGGFEAGRLYEVVYVARDPVVAGLGLVALRDFTSYLKYSPESPLRVERAHAFGASQTGRIQRHFLYQGFNLDTARRRVFDGIYALVGGGGRGCFNHRFAQPSRANSAFFVHDYPVDIFPFTSAVQRDPETGREEGLLAHLPGVARPKVFQVNTGYELWGRAASLIHTSVDGTSDAPIPDDERIYVFASAQHGPASMPPKREENLAGFEVVRTELLLNPANYQWSLRALLLALDTWVATGTEPPASRYPRVADGQLVDPADLAFPKIPGIPSPPRPYVPRRLDFGPRFAAEGIIDHQPPKAGAAYGVRVGQVDADGNELGGIRMPEVTVPLATYTGWNVRRAEGPANGELALLVGGWIPFARDAASRQEAGDPRPSVAERYSSRDEYMGRYAAAAVELVGEGLVLAEDLPAMMEYAGRLWEEVVGGADAED